MTDYNLAVLAMTIPAHDAHALAAMLEVIAAKHEYRRQRAMRVQQILEARDNPHAFDGTLASCDDDPDFCPTTGEAMYV